MLFIPPQDSSPMSLMSTEKSSTYFLRPDFSHVRIALIVRPLMTTIYIFLVLKIDVYYLHSILKYLNLMMRNSLIFIVLVKNKNQRLQNRRKRNQLNQNKKFHIKIFLGIFRLIYLFNKLQIKF